MLISNSQSLHQTKSKIFSLLLLFSISAAEISAQVKSPPAAAGEDNTLWYILLAVLAVGLAGVIYWRFSSKTEQVGSASALGKGDGDTDGKALDADKEMEWLRKNQKLVGKRPNRNPAAKKRINILPKVEPTTQQNEVKPENSAAVENETKSPLPIFSVSRLELARPFDALPISNDEDLMSAIEQGYDEFEEDEEVRDLAVRILAAFKTRNSVEALAQVALYDLSASLRSKAVTILSEFDHESVFETILLANADPTREVRAAAARGLTKLTFDRADAWTRIAEAGEDGRTVQAARAAMESGFVDMSFDRLTHTDRKYVYEAFTLMTLLIKAGETGKIFNALEKHRDMNVRLALLHTIKVVKDQRALDGLYLLLENNNLPIEFQAEVDRTIEEIGFVTA